VSTTRASAEPDFAVVLRARRRGLDLTQAELAERVPCALGTIRRLEAGTLRPSRQMADRLAAILDLSEPEREAFVARARGLAPTPTPTLEERTSAVESRPIARLPRPPTRLVGRVHLLAVLADVLDAPDVRALTLTGPPGVGKTRMGLALADSLAARFPDGVVYVPLADIPHDGLVPAAILQTLEIGSSSRPPLDALAARLESSSLLLVLDNFEHVVGASQLLGELLAATSNLKLLVTSRVALRIAGEHEFAIPALAVPQSPALALEQVASTAAVELFVDRVRSIVPGFQLDSGSAPVAAEICQRLDGVPLAIELAAMRAKVLPLQRLLQELDDRLPALRGGRRDAPARQQTMEAAVAWSEALLDAPERDLFAGLSVFSGGWTLESMQTLFDDDVHLLDSLATLVDSSLVQVERVGERDARYSMLEIVRAFAAQRLEETGRSEALHLRHATEVSAEVAGASAALFGADQSRALARVNSEMGNIRAALTWSTRPGGDPLVGLAIATDLWWFWWASGRVAEGRTWLGTLLQLAPNVDPPREALARVGIGALAFLSGDFHAARRDLERARALAQALKLGHLEAYALLNLGSIHVLEGNAAGVDQIERSAALLESADQSSAWFLGTTRIVQSIVATNAGQLDAAEALANDALQVFRDTVGQPYGIGSALNYLGDVARLRNDWHLAAVRYEEAIQFMQDSGVRSDVPALHHNLGYVALHTGDLTGAREAFVTSLRMHRDVDNRSGIAECLFGLAAVTAVDGDHLEAARLVGAAERYSATSDMPAWAPEQAERTHYLEPVRQLLGEDVWRRERASGERQITLDSLLSTGAHPRTSPSRPGGPR
jgi:predicted ATPase/transcriptional regulator with XRE-family HTH domain